MKKIMFNDRYGLTQAVLEGKKTMTRRIIKGNFEDVRAYHANGGWHFIADTDDGDSIELKPRYEIGEKVAIAQSYEDLANSRYCIELGMMDSPTTFKKEFCGQGWRNKMFVKAEYMPHQIQITDVKIERLQDITDEDCRKEGIQAYNFDLCDFKGVRYGYGGMKGDITRHLTPRNAFHELICKLSGKNIWIDNPYVFAYSFKLIK